jgi:hypothetical protein
MLFDLLNDLIQVVGDDKAATYQKVVYFRIYSERR